MLIPISPSDFLETYWQRRPLFVPDAIKNVVPALSADELAWLATLPDVESRLVLTERVGDEVSYRLLHGPFAESDLQSLPEKDWTLLVQDVDKHLPDFRDWFARVNFIPDWRIDDLMISFAAPGGSVGPHQDNYDVFLCQGDGQREWLVGSPDNMQPDEASTELSLLLPFAATESHKATPGDVLYLPPGVPHWGVATDFCTTYSIGFRAPTKSELIAGAGRVLRPDEEPELACGNDEFYKDPDLQVAEANGGQLSPMTIERVREQKLLETSLGDDEIALVFGSVVTDPKAWLMPEPIEKSWLEDILPGNVDVSVHGMARVAWYEGDSTSFFFANGLATAVPPGCIDFIRQLCAVRFVNSSAIRHLCAAEGGRDFMDWLCAQGILDAGHNAE
jgi:50S ribosomal protein L16 3-hydroxylase